MHMLVVFRVMRHLHDPLFAREMLLGVFQQLDQNLGDADRLEPLAGQRRVEFVEIPDQVLVIVVDGWLTNAQLPSPRDDAHASPASSIAGPPDGKGGSRHHACPGLWWCYQSGQTVSGVTRQFDAPKARVPAPATQNGRKRRRSRPLIRRRCFFEAISR
jgi:hypothetical protein